MPFKICTFLKTSSAIGGRSPDVSWEPMTYCVAAEPASTILQTVNASKYFGYFIRLLLPMDTSCRTARTGLAFFIMVICTSDYWNALASCQATSEDVLVDGRDGLYIICLQRKFPQKEGQDEKRTISRFVGSDRPADGARPGPRASRGDAVRDGQTDHTSGNRNGIQICQSPSPSVFRSEGRGGQPGGMGCRVGRTAVPVVQLRLESECLEGRRLDHHYGGASQRRPKDAAHSQNREPERARVDRGSRGAVGSPRRLSGREVSP